MLEVNVGMSKKQFVHGENNMFVYSERNVRLMLEHTIFMLQNYYVTDTFACGSCVCTIIFAVASLVVYGRNGIQSEDEKLIKRCEFLAIISLIGYCILEILNFIFLP